MNCLGTLLVGTGNNCPPVDPATWSNRIASWTSLAARAAELSQVGEIEEPLHWSANLRIPFDLVEELQRLNKEGEEPPPPLPAPHRESYAPTPGTRWRVGLFKCAESSSHPHWAAWAPIGDHLNFHQPEFFGYLHFLASREVQ